MVPRRYSHRPQTGPIRPLFALAGSLILLFLLASPAWAQDVREELGGKVRMGDEVLVGRDEVVEDDLYIFAGTARIDGTVQGDLVAFGGEVDVSGTVEGDVIAAGGQVEVSGEVAGDIRAAGGQVRVLGEVGEDLVAAGGRVTLGSRATAAQDLVFAAGVMSLAGDVAGNVLGAAGTYSNTGDVAGDETVTEGQDEAREGPTFGERVADFVRDYLAVLVIGVLVILALRRPLRGAYEALTRRLAVSALAGFLFAVALVLGLVVLFVVGILLALALAFGGFGSLLATVILIMVGAVLLVALLLFVLGAWVAPAVVAVWLGSLVLRSGVERGWQPFAALAIGALVILLLYLVPILGPLLRLVVFLLGTGALVLHQWGLRRRAGISPPGPDEPLPA